MTTLKPCPFCGSTDVDTTGNDEVWFVGCNQCEAGYGHSTFDSAQGQWNTRVSPWRSLKDDPPTAPVLACVRKPCSSDPFDDDEFRDGYVYRMRWMRHAKWSTPIESYIEWGFTEWMELPE